MSSFLITGSSRGVGLELIRQLADKPISEVQTVFATARTNSAPRFQELLREHPERVIFVPLDITDESSVTRAVELVESKLDGNRLDVLINNAGVSKFGSLEEIERQRPSPITNSFLPLLRKGNAKKIASISTSVGSFALQENFRNYPAPSYKISKAALNMLTQLYSQSLDDEGFTVFCVSPGWLKTDMGGSGADLPVEMGSEATLDVVFKTGREGNGRFFNIHVPGWEKNPGLNQYDGGELPW
ncbi:short chain oxidoreductase [Aspergillus sclerotiicarbonarius CBS 121057]|uniref:Short chain oxidoreductase n=1 Tax=Aspergillus sclerotiicarbonarius (strain CBS 121057 / IBT 28362) TaxID=1448318 RepID=A0A319EDT1_ASPSB|nr:short chain oxidoreductase [Aspergillus sclerotiicarbonarius CBS 121057]